MTASVTYTLTVEDLRTFRRRPSAGSRLARLRRPWLAVVLFTIGAALYVATLRLEMRQRHPDIDAVIGTSFLAGASTMGALGLLLGAYRRRRYLRRADARLVALGPIDLRADDERLETLQADVRSSMPWSSVTAIEETPAHLFLILGSEEAIVVPRSAVRGTLLGDLLAGRAEAMAMAAGRA